MIVNTDYAWRDPPRKVPEFPAWVSRSALRATGSGVNDAVVAHATGVMRHGAVALGAVEIDSGTRAGYLADK